MKTHYKKIYRSGGIFALLIAALGFATSCEDTRGYAMYGTPSADYELKVKVVDSLNAPIGNVRVIIDRYELEQRTNSEGVADFNFTGFPGEVKGRFEDVDAEENGGQYKTLDTTFHFNHTLFQKEGKSDGWYRGLLKTEVKVELRKTNRRY